MTMTSSFSGRLIVAAAISLAALTRPDARIEGSVPVILRVLPSSPASSLAPQMVTVDGREFLPGLAVRVFAPDGGSVPLAESAIQEQNDSMFRASILFARVGRYSLVVTNPDGGTSAPFPVDVTRTPRTAAPVIEDVTPRDLAHDRATQDLHVIGRNFDVGLSARMTNPLGEDVTDISVSAVSATSFELRVLLDTGGDYELAIVNRSGAVSNVWRISVAK